MMTVISPTTEGDLLQSHGFQYHLSNDLQNHLQPVPFPSARLVHATAYLMSPPEHLMSTSNFCSKGILDFPLLAVFTISVKDTHSLKPQIRSHPWLLLFPHSIYIILSPVSSVFKILMNWHILTTSTATILYKPSPSHTGHCNSFPRTCPASLFASL